MPRLGLRGVLLASALVAATGCGGRVQGGLASAPSLSRFSRADAQSPPHEPLSNGNESCSRNASGRSALRGRVPPCPSDEGRAQGIAADALFFDTRDSRLPAPGLPSASPVGPCAAWTLASWQLTVDTEPERVLCGTACTPSLLGCAAGWRRPR